MENNGR